MRIFFLTWTYPGPNLQSLDLLTALSARLMIPIFKFYSPYKYASAITEVPIKLLIVRLSNININIKHTCFLIPPWSWYLFSDQLLIIQPEFLMLGHTKPNSHCIKTNEMYLEIPLLISVRIISALLATAVVQKVAISYYPFWFPILYSLFPSQRPLSCNYSCALG